MRILLDTNIIIPLEDSSKTLDESFSELVRLANANNHLLIAHPASLDDIQRDLDPQRKAISLSRIRKYPFLENPPLLDAAELERLALKQDNENDKVDNLILYSIYRDAANILVTEDREVHRKAAQLGLDDRVYYIQQATESLLRLQYDLKLLASMQTQELAHAKHISGHVPVDVYEFSTSNYSHIKKTTSNLLGVSNNT